MKKDRVKDKFLGELERTPIIQYACEKCGISRNTYYRWCADDYDFKRQAEERLGRGVDVVNDFAESNLLNGIKRGDLNSTKFWLNSRHKVYRRPSFINFTNQEESPEERARKIQEYKEDIKRNQDKWFKKPCIRQEPNKPTKNEENDGSEPDSPKLDTTS